MRSYPTRETTAEGPSASPPNLPRVFQLARRAGSVTPDAPLDVVCELLRNGPYHQLPVIRPTPAGEVLLGIVTEKSVADALLRGEDDHERGSLRQFGVAADVLVPLPADDCATPGQSALAVSALLDRTGREAVPVIESVEQPYYRGMIARSDLIRDLVRPVTPPMIGGMATPLGVYLTTGGVSGGVGSLALAGTGLFMLGLQLAGTVSLHALDLAAHRYVPQLTLALNHLPHPLTHAVPETLATLAQSALFFTLLRFSPVAGYHAAEHQVVHTIERGQPLLPEVVRAQPRVHPRCSTNLVAGVFLFGLIGSVLTSLLATSLQEGTAEVAYLLAGIATLLWWRPVGSWLQEHATTRPASPREIESGIRAARALLSALDTPITAAIPAPRSPAVERLLRLWHMGLLQTLIGFTLGSGILILLAQIYPAFRAFLP